MLKGIKGIGSLHKCTVAFGVTGLAFDLYFGVFPAFMGGGMLIGALFSYVVIRVSQK